MHRRDFLRYMAALGLVSGAGRLVLPEEVWAMAPQETPQCVVAKVLGANHAQSPSSGPDATYYHSRSQDFILFGHSFRHKFLK